MRKLALFNKIYFSISVISFQIEMDSDLETNTWAMGYMGEMYIAYVIAPARQLEDHSPIIWQFGEYTTTLNSRGSKCDYYNENEVFEVTCYTRLSGYEKLGDYYRNVKLVSIFNLKRELRLEDDEAVIRVEFRALGQIEKLNVTITVKGSFLFK